MPILSPLSLAGLPEHVTPTQFMLSKPMSCGSGKPRTYTCEACHDRKMAQYRPDVLTDPSYWTDEPIEDD